MLAMRCSRYSFVSIILDYTKNGRGARRVRQIYFSMSPARSFVNLAPSATGEPSAMSAES